MPSNVQQTFSSEHSPTVGCIIPGFEYLIKHWETMAAHSQYLGLIDALDGGLKSLHKWYGWVDGTSPAYFICLGMFVLSYFINSSKLLTMSPWSQLWGYVLSGWMGQWAVHAQHEAAQKCGMWLSHHRFSYCILTTVVSLTDIMLNLCKFPEWWRRISQVCLSNILKVGVHKKPAPLI